MQADRRSRVDFDDANEERPGRRIEDLCAQLDSIQQAMTKIVEMSVNESDFEPIQVNPIRFESFYGRATSCEELTTGEVNQVLQETCRLVQHQLTFTDSCKQRKVGVVKPRVVESLSRADDEQHDIGTVKQQQVASASSEDAGSDRTGDTEETSSDEKKKESVESTILSDDEVQQIECFLRGRNCDVCVCNCIATLCFTSAAHVANLKEWTPARTGVPVWVFNHGSWIRKREFKIILSERGTGFILWQEAIDFSSDYKSPRRDFHTFLMHSRRGEIAGLKFDDTCAADEFFRFYAETAAKPENADLFAGPDRKASKKKEKKAKDSSSGGPRRQSSASGHAKRHSSMGPHPPPPPSHPPSTGKSKLNKADISQPCCFQHITKGNPGESRVSVLFNSQTSDI